MRLVETGATGLRAQQTAIDTIGNNIANVNTPGFKAKQMTFAEALAAEVRSGNIEPQGNTAVTVGVGAGVLYEASGTDFQQGNLVSTDRSLDLGIDGAGFFQVSAPDGETYYTRGGAFQINGDRRLSDMQGNLLQPNIFIPEGAADIAVAANGEVSGVVGEESTVFGQIPLVGFSNPEGLLRSENNLYAPTVNSGQPQMGQAGSAIAGNLDLGTIRSKSIEESNVDLAASMTDLIQAQRAYQVNAQLVQDGDKMWGMANTLRR